ncbi:MAG: hypothetical protein HKN32_00585 [Flavobacteriales bacterium]|nr:hypothetical protein [Flavobacteriales bacterium]
MYRYIGLLVVLLGFVGCQQVAGEGGKSSIKGQVLIDYRIVLTNPDSYQTTVPGADEDVFIIYGDHISPDDQIETNFDGEFEFRNLRPGDYTLYVYSSDTTGDPEAHPNRMPISVDVTIENRNESIDLGILRIYDKP